MKFRFLFLTLLWLSSCEENHQHDGVYISEEPYLGVMKTWVVEGNSLTFYMMGITKVKHCKQYEDRIESEDVVYSIDSAGNLWIPGKDGKPTKEKLVKRSNSPKHTTAELDKMIDEAMPPPALLRDRE